MKTIKKCQSPYCEKSIEGNRRKFCSYDCYNENRRGQWKNTECLAEDCNNQFKSQGTWKKYCCSQCNARQRERNRSKEIKAQLFNIYGNKCKCCGETEIAFLTLEHKLGDRVEHLKQVGNNTNMWKDAIENVDHERFEILCMNCNWAKGQFGYCPHERGR